MSPEAKAGYAAPTARVPRTIFQHAHIDGNAEFPPSFAQSQMAEVFAHLPDNWNGFDAFYLKLLGGQTEATTIDITINAGTCDELFNIHTQTVNDIAINMVVDEYECLDLMTLFATVIALMNSDDDLWITATDDGEFNQFLIGVVIEES